ncbi:MAG TPA: hypothetical protein VFQ61_30265 [Polyangiaceae bacterium]|nr:hypothetical protein [Polyangiaceae bacterium]
MHTAAALPSLFASPVLRTEPRLLGLTNSGLARQVLNSEAMPPAIAEQLFAHV